MYMSTAFLVFYFVDGFVKRFVPAAAVEKAQYKSGCIVLYCITFLFCRYLLK